MCLRWHRQLFFLCGGVIAKEREACTLVFSIAPLDLLMCVLLNLALKDPRSSWLVEAGCLQDVRSIDPVVGPPAHNMFLELCAELVLPDWDLIKE